MSIYVTYNDFSRINRTIFFYKSQVYKNEMVPDNTKLSNSYPSYYDAILWSFIKIAMYQSERRCVNVITKK